MSADDIHLEHRIHIRLREYWNTLRKGLQFPAESLVNPDDLADIWDSCFLISLDDVTRRLGYRYSYMGNDLLVAYGGDPNHEGSTNQIIASPNGTMIAKFDEVQEKRCPVIDESEFVNSREIPIRYRSCILPLGLPNGEMTHLIGCMRWKMY